jgi:YihY family inner membrane protein
VAVSDAHQPPPPTDAGAGGAGPDGTAPTGARPADGDDAAGADDSATRAKFAVRAKRKVDELQQRRRPVAFLAAVLRKSQDDQAGIRASLMTHFILVSVFPLALFVVTIIGIVLRDDPAGQKRLYESFLVQIPVIGPQIESSLGRLPGSGFALLVGILGLLFGSFGMANSAQETMAIVWQQPRLRWPRGPRRLVRSVLTIAVIGIPTVVNLAVAWAAGDAMRGASNGPLLAPELILGAVGILLLTYGFALLLFRAVTPGVVPARALLPGAALFAVVWTVLSNAGGVLLNSQMQRSSQLYGFFGTIISFIFWMYLTTYALVLAAEVNVVRHLRLWPRSFFPPPLTDADRYVLEGLARLEERLPGQSNSAAFDLETMALGRRRALAQPAPLEPRPEPD